MVAAVHADRASCNRSPPQVERGKSELRRTEHLLTGGCRPAKAGWQRKASQKTYRPASPLAKQDKGEKASSCVRLVGTAEDLPKPRKGPRERVRAHRPGGNTGSQTSPARSKTKHVPFLPPVRERRAVRSTSLWRTGRVGR